jgi:signal transduction histidine kinase
MPLPFTLAVHQPAWEWIHTPATALALSCFLIFPLIFPTGRFIPRWTRWMALFEIAGAVIAILFQNYILEVRGGQFLLVFLLISFGTGVYAQLYRYFRVASPVERQQLKWVIVGLAGFASTGVAVLLPLDALLISQAGSMDPARALVLSFIPDTLFRVISLFIPVSIAISVLRYRLWDIDILINRSLVYGALTASVVGLYVLIVGGFGLLFHMQNSLPGIIIAILLIVFLFQPMRGRLQDLVNRFVPVPQAIMSQSIATPAPQTEQQQKVDVTDSVPSTILHGRWLILARLAWAAGFTVLTAMYALGFLAVREVLSTVCNDELCTLRQQIRHTDAGEQIAEWPGPPVGYADRLRSDQVEALETLGLTLDQYGWLAALQMGIPALVLLLIAAGLFWWKPDHWMVLFASVMVATFPLHNTPLPFTLEVRQPAWEWVFDAAGIVALSCLLIFPLIFPTGRFVPRWTRWMALYEVAGAVLVTLFGNTILAVSGRAFIGVVLLLPSFGVGVYAQLYRYFRVASPAERQQFKWVVVGLVGFVVTQLIVLIPLNALLTSPAVSADPARRLVLSAIPDTLWQLNNLFIAVTITFSVLRYRLWDIDIFINRSLVYGALIVSVIGLYMIGVGLASVLFQSVGNTLLAILATGLIAVLFHPLRQRLQSAINHLMYGERDDPYVALSRLGRRLESSLASEAVLPTVVTTVREVLKLPYVAIYLQQDSHGYKIVAEAASPSLRIEGGRIRVPGMEREGRCIPLIHQGETLGYIVLGPRAPNEAFSSTDLHLLEDLAPQVGVAVHAVRLTADLQRSRERLVVAREEERRRLRRDLHDGLGPQLAGLALKLETLRNRLNGDPLADSLLADLAKRTQEATADIRHLVYELRPPTLDELGLASALRESVTQYTQQGCNDLNIIFDAPESLPPLPAAVEVAVYRITQEAVLNVMRHADARTCQVRLRLDESAGLLCLEIQDDGKGLPMKRRAGVGLNSMRERAEELGGTLAITPIPTGGTSLLARLPCRPIEPAPPVDQDALDASDQEV